MCIKNGTKIIKKPNKMRRGKGGFTLAELCIVLALVAVVSVMIVSFSTLMGDHTTALDDQYDFLADCSTLESALRIWVAEYDVEGSSFAANGGELEIRDTVSDTVVVEFRNGTLSFKDKKVQGLHTVADVSFEINGQGDLIKCIVTAKDGVEKDTHSFVFSLRAGATARAGEGAHE